MVKRRVVEAGEIEISDDCVGSAQCSAVAPDVFRLGEDGHAAFVAGTADANDLESALVAESVCPSAAIRVVLRATVDRPADR